MSTDPRHVYSRAEVAAGAKHFARTASGMPGLGRKDLARAERQAAEGAESAAEAGTLARLDRHAGELAAARVLSPAHIVQGRATAEEMPAEGQGYTAADVEALRARYAADDTAERPEAQQRSHTVHMPAQRRTGGFIR